MLAYGSFFVQVRFSLLYFNTMIIFFLKQYNFIFNLAAAIYFYTIYEF